MISQLVVVVAVVAVLVLLLLLLLLLLLPRPPNICQLHGIIDATVPVASNVRTDPHDILTNLHLAMPDSQSCEWRVCSCPLPLCSQLPVARHPDH